MENSKNFKIFGCFDLLTSSFQILVTCANTYIALSLPLTIGKLDGSHHTSHLLQAVILAVAVVVIYFNSGQLMTARNLMKVGHNVIINDISNRYLYFIIVLNKLMAHNVKN